MKKNSAQFFCENCGAEVPEKAKVCTHCGKFFSSVRCPKCAWTGLSKDFKDGCPKCGYSGKSSNSNIRIPKAQEENTKGRRKDTNIFLDFINKNYKAKNSAARNDSALPAWIYIATASILVFVLAASYSCLSGKI